MTGKTIKEKRKAPVKKLIKKKVATPVSVPRLINREMSWISFNLRVLAQASNDEIPILERLKFLAIFESNLDEFFMVRVSGLIEQLASGITDLSPDGMNPTQQLKQLMKLLRPNRKEASQLLYNILIPKLKDAGINIHKYSELTDRQKQSMTEYFEKEIYPLCTPLILHPAATVPFISNRSLNLLVELENDDNEPKIARVKVPSIISRFVRLSSRKNEYVLLEEVIQAHLSRLFPGVKILGSYAFRVIRDADIEIRELEAADLITSIEETIRLRRFGDAVLVEIQDTLPDRLKNILLRVLDLDKTDVLKINGMLGYEAFLELGMTDKPSAKYPIFSPYFAESLGTARALFELISLNDVFVHHPFDSFRSVEEFVASAAKDLDVIGIKQTLYRVGTESPIVESLLDAGESGKQVAAMVELKARFDESNNLVWARALERAGVHVTFGFPEMKTHCKLCLVVRREDGHSKQYAHIGTGNYNPATARLYTDFGLFTCNSEICQDISELFNFLTGFSRQTNFRKLLVAPVNLRERVLELIHDEIAVCKATGKGRIILKVNALVDPEAIEALYEASQAGVQVDLIVRGVCCLRARVPGMSENIQVVSIVGRFLEHSRTYYFQNGGSPRVYIGSADLMRRNLDRRIEVLTPVESHEIIRQVHSILEVYLKDNQQCWELGCDDLYVKRTAKRGKKFSAQDYFINESNSKRLVHETSA